MTASQSLGSAAPLLEVRGVEKSFPGVKALSEMHLEVRAGEVLALVGENGAGKSTLMKILSGVQPQDAGSILFEGREVSFKNPAEAKELGIAIIHQEFNLMPDLTVAANIYIGQEPRKAGLFTSSREINDRATELLKSLRLPLRPSARVGELSVAQQQMVEIAKAMSAHPRVLIMDEPTAALNDEEVAALHDIIRGFVTPTTAVVYISHRMEELRVIADRVTVIRDGQYIHTFPDARRLAPGDLVSKMVGRELAAAPTKPRPLDPAAPVVLAVEGLTNTKLRDVSLDLHRGEILGIAGLMGAGRTELARAIVAADPSAGRIQLNGQSVRFRSPTDATRAGISYLSEDRKNAGLLLNQDLVFNTILPSVGSRFSRFGFIRRGSAVSATQQQVSALRTKTPSVRQVAKNLSGGNQQKVIIGRWLVNDCPILIFDEPTRGIDVGAKEEIYDIMNRLAESGKSIIMISSELPEVLRMSHRVLVMSNGRIAGELSHEEASQEAIMELATGNRKFQEEREVK